MTKDTGDSDLHYIAVAYKTTLLCDYSKNEGNFRDFLGKIMKYLKYGRYILTYKENNIFYIKDKEDKGLTFILITGEDNISINAFVALERTKEDFLKYFTREEFAIKKINGLQKDFEGKLERHFVFFFEIRNK